MTTPLYENPSKTAFTASLLRAFATKEADPNIQGSDDILQSPLQTLILLARSVTSFDGDRYEGEYKKGEFNGQGIFTSFDGDRYVG